MAKTALRLIALLLAAWTFSAAAQDFQRYYAFPSSYARYTIGEKPASTLTLGQDGNLYGTTTKGGKYSAGTAFRVTTTGEAKWLGDFKPSTTGDTPVSKLIDIGDGKLYGVTAAGNYGALYYIDAARFGDANDTQLHLFPLFQVPAAGPHKARALCSGEPGIFHLLCEDPAGLYRVPANGDAPTLAYTFGSPQQDGLTAYTLISGGDGFLYGTTTGSYVRPSDGKSIYGTIFRIRADGTGMTRLHEFLREEGATPKGSLTVGPDGDLYGMTNDGGPAPGNGTFCRIDRYGEHFKTIRSFHNVIRYPAGELLYAPDGYFYGTAENGASGFGAVYRMKPDGSGFKVLHAFQGTSADGGNPTAGLTLAPDGNLYGVTSYGDGTVFRLFTKFGERPANRAPTAVDDLITFTSTPAELFIPVLENDFDPDGDPLTVSIVTPPAYGTLESLPGQALRYTPGSSFINQDNFTYSISDGRGGVAQATVRIRPDDPEPLPPSVLYTGILRQQGATVDDPAAGTPRAQIRLQLTTKGRFTGTLQTQRKRLAFQGALSSDGTALIHLRLPDRSKAILFLGRHANEQNAITVTLYGSLDLRGLARRGTTSDARKRILALDDFPATDFSQSGTTLAQLGRGISHATITISPGGGATVVGRLGDGTRLSASTHFVRANGSPALPIFAEPLPGGLFGSDVYPDAGTSNPARWIRPAAKAGQPYEHGFDLTTGLEPSEYQPPDRYHAVLPQGTATFTFQGANLPTDVAADCTVTTHRVIHRAPLKELLINRATGAFTGKILIDGAHVVPFTGNITRPSYGQGYGVFTYQGIGGAITISAKP